MEDNKKESPESPKQECPDVLDGIRKIEKITKAMVMAKVVKEVKDYAKTILELKEKSILLLQESGVAEDDVKRVIDFLNNSSDVKLTGVKKSKLRDEAITRVEQIRDGVVKAQEKHQDAPLFAVYSNMVTSPYDVSRHGSFTGIPLPESSYTITCDSADTVVGDQSALLFCNTDGGSLKVKI